MVYTHNKQWDIYRVSCTQLGQFSPYCSLRPRFETDILLVPTVWVRSRVRKTIGKSTHEYSWHRSQLGANQQPIGTIILVPTGCQPRAYLREMAPMASTEIAPCPNFWQCQSCEGDANFQDTNIDQRATTPARMHDSRTRGGETCILINADMGIPWTTSTSVLTTGMPGRDGSYSMKCENYNDNLIFHLPRHSGTSQ